ncbi:hypothetical protein B7P34_12000 [Streptosporangium nondiastaticum]|uniref:Uncharacterized protein n=1 Tax=Streptosporangium nondiastaticum TaxID=35764 RepID=A0A9X7JRA6_9ACTN|nr:hypothetical protein B7P34_12000 [Streptosporangium nondiastaticum]
MRADVRVTSVGSDRYSLTVYLYGECLRGSFLARNPDMALEYGGSGESWKRIESPCGTGKSGTSSSTFEGSGSGRLSADKRVHLRAGA